jgi:hypothetical protein
MPLRAVVNNEEQILAPLLTCEEWSALNQRVKLKEEELRLPCCGNIAYMRTSKHGLNHFVHKERDTCTSAPETWQHLKAKHEIVLACRAAGYEAITEIAGDGWRADVLATRGNTKIAFEVQWSRQTWEETLKRQQKYSKANIRGCWLFKQPPQCEANQTIPFFKLEVDEEAATVVFNPTGYKYTHGKSQRIPLKDFIGLLLSGKLKFCEMIRALPRQTVRIVFIEIECWKCHKPHHIYYVNDLSTRCGDTIEVDCFNSQIVSTVIQHLKTGQFPQLKVGYIKERYSRTVQYSYMSFGCPHCDAIVGDFFLRHDILLQAPYLEEEAVAILEKEMILKLEEIMPVSNPHWCFPENGQFCCGKPI